MGADRHLKVVRDIGDAEPGVITREIQIDASAEDVFSFFTDPAKHVLWQGTEAELDPRPGGTLRLTFAPGHVATGTYLEVEPPTRIVYTWGWTEEGSSELPPGSSTVEVTFEPAGDGTLLRVRHSGLPETMFEFHNNGWNECLSELHRRVTSSSERGADLADDSANRR